LSPTGSSSAAGARPDPAADEARRAELAANLGRVRARIADACAAAGRERGEITLVAVAKTYPASDVLHLAELGVRDIGENRDQEAAPKVALVAAAGAEVRWHFIGQLQRNKARSVARYAHLVHSVDRPELVQALARAREAVMGGRPPRGGQPRPAPAPAPGGGGVPAAGESSAAGALAPLGVLLQVGLDDAAGRGGVPPAELIRLADAVAAQPALALRGVMAVAPLDAPAEPAFARLAEVAAALREAYPAATVISAGMSGDLEAAVTHGATHVRIGSALLGNRAPLR
jgi:PLP dependent protein